MSFNLSKIQALTKDKFTENHVTEFTQMYMMGEKELIPDSFAHYLAERGPRTEDEVALWVWLCLEKQGLSGPLTRKPNDLQPTHTAQVKFMSDCFFEKIQDVIVLGNRASGKTLMFGALIALESMYKPFMEHAHLGAIKEQASKCYSYFKKIVEHPMFIDRLKASTQARTTLYNGSEISILTGTMTGVNCLHGDTLIDCSRDILVYPNGVPIRDLVGKEIVVPTIHEGTGHMEYRKAKGIYSGKAPCVKVTISYKDIDTNCGRTEEVICTPEHRFLMFDSHKYKEAQSLQPGDHLVPTVSGYTVSNHVVERVEWYMNGEPQDVYDLSVETLEEDEHYRHNFSLWIGITIRNSPHPIVSSLDEADLMGWNILQEALMMSSSSRGYLASTRITSTRKFSNGPMQRLIDEAVQRNMIIQQWNLWDVIEPCPLRTDKTTYVEVPVYSAKRDTFVNREVEVFDDCLTCALLPKCQSKAKYSHGGLVTIPDAIRMYHTLDKEIWDAQVECLRPGSSDVIYNMFSEATHVIHNYEFNPNRPVYAGQDFGYHQPATVFLQPLDDNMDKWIVFDEIYEGDIATSVLISDFILPKFLEYNVQLFLCDPAGKASIADMEVQGLPVIAGENVVEAGIDLVKSLFASNRLYISDKCVNLLLELKKYSRTEAGRIRKENDHACDALRYAVMEINQYAGSGFDVYY